MTPGERAAIAWKYAPGTHGTTAFKANFRGGTYKVYFLAKDGRRVPAGPVTLTVR